MTRYHHEGSVFNVSFKHYGKRTKVSAQIRHGEKVHKLKLGLINKVDHLSLIGSESVSFTTNRLSNAWIAGRIKHTIPVTEIEDEDEDQVSDQMANVEIASVPAVVATEHSMMGKSSSKNTISKTVTPGYLVQGCPGFGKVKKTSNSSPMVQPKTKPQTKKGQKGRKGKVSPKTELPKSKFS